MSHQLIVMKRSIMYKLCHMTAGSERNSETQALLRQICYTLQRTLCSMMRYMEQSRGLVLAQSESALQHSSSCFAGWLHAFAMYVCIMRRMHVQSSLHTDSISSAAHTPPLSLPWLIHVCMS